MEEFIGRTRELSELGLKLDSGKSEFIAVYGRRRVGKTLLIRAAAGDVFSFFVTGQYDRPRAEQLMGFAIALQRYSKSPGLKVDKNWVLAFYSLSKYLETLPEGRKIVFIDELPWMDTPKSGFVAALDNFWNSWAVLRDDIKLIVCGSSTSWMLDNIIHETGGLHKRLTDWMLLQPFSLGETEFFLKKKGFRYSRKQIAECYMVMGGVPYYLSLLDKSKSVAQNIDELFFAENAKLKGEFNEIFQALYRKSENHKKILSVVATRGGGMTRGEILDATGLVNNGEFSRMLAEIEECGFIRSYQPFGKIKRNTDKREKTDTLFQLIDPYSLFYHKYILYNKYGDEHFWTSGYLSPEHNTWAGLSFEILCLNHIRQIKSALSIGGVQSNVCSWREHGIGQIDLLIDRKDDTINLCEMKFAREDYVFSEDEAAKLSRRINAFLKTSGTGKSIIVTLVTTYGLKANANSSDIQCVVTLDELFA